MKITNLSYASISKVFHTWELARQKYSNDQQLGTEILLNLFDLEPKIKIVFGLQMDKDFRNDATFRTGVTGHGLRVAAKLDSMISLLGPDVAIFDDILHTLGERHTSYGVQKEFIHHMPRAICKAMETILPKNEWDKDSMRAWKLVTDYMVKVIANSMK